MIELYPFWAQCFGPAQWRSDMQGWVLRIFGCPTEAASQFTTSRSGCSNQRGTRASHACLPRVKLAQMLHFLAFSKVEIEFWAISWSWILLGFWLTVKPHQQTCRENFAPFWILLVAFDHSLSISTCLNKIAYFCLLQHACSADHGS